jgi:hypothetical protein
VLNTPQKRLYCQLAPLEHHITVIGYSLWPTPAYTDDKVRQPPGNPHITKNGTLRHINKAGTQSCVRTSQAVRYWDGQGFENPEWKEILMGLPPGYTDLTRQRTSPDGRRFKARDKIAMSRRVSSKLKEARTLGAFERSATALSGSRYSLLHRRLSNGLKRRIRRNGVK